MSDQDVKTAWKLVIAMTMTEEFVSELQQISTHLLDRNERDVQEDQKKKHKH